MAILERIRRIARGNITQWLNQVETPEAEVEEKIHELEGASVEAKNALASFAVTYKRLEKQLQEYAASQADLQGRAESAMGAGDEKSARRFLAERMKVEERLRQLEPVLESRRATYNELKEHLVEIHDQLSQARARLLDLRARKRAADAEHAMGRQMERLDGGGEELFERLEDEVLGSESRVEIDRELRGDLRGADPAKALRDAKVDAEMAALKSKLTPKKETP